MMHRMSMSQHARLRALFWYLLADVSSLVAAFVCIAILLTLVSILSLVSRSKTDMNLTVILVRPRSWQDL